MQSDLKIPADKRIPQLDGLRGIAILMVMCYHFFPNNIICNFGWSGVDLFFVLSGYLITGRLIPFLDDKKLLRNFYRNRFLRIVPLYFGFLSIFFTAWFLLIPKETLINFPFYQHYGWSFFVFIQNHFFTAEIFASKPHLQHLWSVAVEEQIYLLFPIFLILIKNKKKIFYFMLTAILLILVSRSIYVAFSMPEKHFGIVYWNSFFRSDSFLAGATVYFIYNSIILVKKKDVFIKWVGVICFLAITLKVAISFNAEKYNYFIASVGYTVIALMYASLLWATLTQTSKMINKLTSFSFLRYTGKISYGIYIIHWPLFLFGFGLINNLFNYFNLSLNSNTIHLLNVLVCIPLTYLISHLSFKYFESFFLKMKKR